MSELIIIGYDEHEAAKKAFERVIDLSRDRIVSLDGLAVITVDDDGKQHVDTPAKGLVGVSAARGALWGMLFGLLFVVPGLAVFGGLWGALFGGLAKSGINRSFKERVDGMLEPGKAAVVLLANKITEDKFAAAMGEFGGTVLQTSLSDEDEKALADELGTE